MERKKNIIYITGRDQLSVDEEADRLIQAFRARQSADNIHSYSVDMVSNWYEVEQEMMMIGLFVEKRLFIFRGSLDLEGRGKKKSGVALESLMRIIESVDDDTFIIFLLRGGGPIQDWLMGHADVRKYDAPYDSATWIRRYPTLDEKYIREVIREYQKIADSHESPVDEISYHIRESLEKISLLSLSSLPTRSDIETSISLRAGGKIFDLIDIIVIEGDITRALTLMHRILEESSIHGLLPSLIGLMRNIVYSKFLKEHGYSESSIIGVLKASPYVVKKGYNTKIPWTQLHGFYDKLLDINIAYRSGLGLYDPELGRIFSIERALMSLKK